MIDGSKEVGPKIFVPIPAVAGTRRLPPFNAAIVSGGSPGNPSFP